MRRTGALILSLVLLCAVPSAVLALNRTISWHATTSRATIYMTYQIRNSQPKRILTFEFNNIPATCPGYASTAVSGTFSQQIRIGSDRRFHATELTNNDRAKYTVRGRFVSLHKAKGHLRITGTVPGCLSADTGSVAWTAKRKG